MRMLFSRHELKRSGVLFSMIVGCVIAGAIFAPFVSLAVNAQDGAGPIADAEANNSEAVGNEAVVDGEVANVEAEGINIFTLILQGGAFTIPIGLMSLITVTFVVERSMALRRDRVIPSGLITELGELAETQSQFDPRAAYRLCQRYPSAAATVIRSMLVKVGRPQAEVDRATTEVSEREADRLYSNIRWLNLSAAVSPLLGLLGTVWGMIQAFHDTTGLPAGVNKADFLAEGIYVALVTTLCGLMVAIPAAVFSHYLEGRLQRLFHEVDELLFSLAPQIERFEGRMRFTNADEDAAGQDDDGASE
jgi:biopolymer transport protein ExbB